MQLLAEIIFQTHLADCVQLAFEIVDGSSSSTRISSNNARDALSATSVAVRIAPFRCFTAFSSSARSFSNWALTFVPTAIGPMSVMFGVPSRKRMRSISFSACTISSMDSLRYQEPSRK